MSALIIILLSAAAGLADVVGGWWAVLLAGAFPRKIIYLVAFGAGFLFALVAIEILPESIKGPASAPFLILFGYLLTFMFEQLLCTHHHHEHTDDHGDHYHEAHPDHTELLLVARSTSMAMFAGMMVHCFFDGVAIAVAGGLGPAMGILVFIGVAVHKIPHTFSLSAVAFSATGNRKEALGVAIAVGVMTVVGAWICVIVGELRPEIRTILLCLAGGNFIYVAATDLLPVVHRNRSPMTTASVLIGVAVYYLTHLLLSGFAGR